jgi:hypothetical protein
MFKRSWKKLYFFGTDYVSWIDHSYIRNIGFSRRLKFIWRSFDGNVSQNPAASIFTLKMKAEGSSGRLATMRRHNAEDHSVRINVWTRTTEVLRPRRIAIWTDDNSLTKLQVGKDFGSGRSCEFLFHWVLNDGFVYTKCYVPGQIVK